MAAQGNAIVRYTHVTLQAYDRWNRKNSADGVEKKTICFRNHLSFFKVHEQECPLDRADSNGAEVLV